MKPLYYCAAILLVAATGLQADQQTTVAGQQRITARRTTKPVVIDGIFGPSEWSPAIPTHVDAVKPATAPGLVPFQGQPWAFNPPRNQNDLSYDIRVMYDDNYLYVAVDVADDIVIADNPDVPWLDDVVEIYINGDNQPYDMDAVRDVSTRWGVLPNNEGFQLDTSAGNVRAVYNFGVDVNWDSKAKLRPRGYLVEARISLDSINTIDNSWFSEPPAITNYPDGVDPTQSANPPGAIFSPVFRRPHPGDTIGFNITVGDDDAGRNPLNPFNPYDDGYNRSDLVPNPSSYVAWDGSSPNWYYADESAWGKLYFQP